MKKILTDIKDYTMTGISYILPVIIGGSLIIGVIRILSYFLGVPVLSEYAESTGIFNYLYQLEQSGWTAIGLMNTLLAGFIAYARVGKAGLAAGFVGGALANSNGSGFIGAVIAGLFAGWIAELVKEKINVSESFEAAKPMVIMPLISVGLTSLLMIVVVATPFGYLNESLTNWVTSMLDGGGSRTTVFTVLGGMMGADLGGPINKAAWAPAQALIAEGIFTPKALINVGAAIAPLGYGIASIIKRNSWSKEWTNTGNASLIMGIIGITEGAIPFTLKNPAKLVPINIIGSAVGTGVASFLGASASLPPVSGVYGFFSVDNPWAYLIGIFVGALIVAAGVILFVKDFEEGIVEEDPEFETDSESMDEIQIDFN